MSYQELLHEHIGILKTLRYQSGLFAASSKQVTTGYDKAWLRDNLYCALALEAIGDSESLLRLFNSLFAILIKHEWKIDYAIIAKPQYSYQYIHARYHPETFDEFWESWGNKQNDAIGALLFCTGSFVSKDSQLIGDDEVTLALAGGQITFRGEDKRRIVQKLISYLEAIAYWQDSDSGAWEENEEIHASSLGACVAGLKKVKEAGFDVADELIQKGEDMLHHEVLPRESHSKFCDLTLLTLMYPYNLLGIEEAEQIIGNIEYHLVKERGVIRYKGDHYYNKNWDMWSEEAEWTFGFSFLSLAYTRLGDKIKAEGYLKKSIETVNDKGEIPELYFSHTNEYNDNSPLAWSEAMLILALKEYMGLEGQI